VSETQVVAVGSPPTFRHQVARAVGTDPTQIEWVPSVIAVENMLTEGRSADLVVLSPAVKDPDAFGLAEFMSRTAPTSSVVLVREKSMDGLLPTAMRSGIRDVVDLSQGGDDLEDALGRALAWSSRLRTTNGHGPAAEPKQRGQVITVFSSKGGTGKTFLTTNLASAIAERTGRDTAVVDLDVRMGDVFAYFGKEPQHSLQSLMGLGAVADRDTLLAAGTSFRPHLWGFGSVSDPAAAVPAGEAMGHVLRSLRSTFDHVVLDGSAEYTDHVLAAFDLSDVICLVATLDVVGVRHLVSAIETLLSLGVPKHRLCVVLNRADSKVGLSPEEVARVTRISIDAMIPSSRLVPAALNAGWPVYLEDPRSEVARAIGSLADVLTGVEAPAPQRSRFGRRQS